MIQYVEYMPLSPEPEKKKKLAHDISFGLIRQMRSPQERSQKYLKPVKDEGAGIFGLKPSISQKKIQESDSKKMPARAISKKKIELINSPERMFGDKRPSNGTKYLSNPQSTPHDFEPKI